MIRKLTVFVLGAGASCHLGFPAAAGLRRLIIQNFGPIQSRNLFLERGFDETAINNFISRFKSSGITSIDAFLELQPEFHEIGKYAIAVALIRYETDDLLWQHIHKPESTNWYEYLFTLLRSEVKKAEDFWSNNFYVITFNYDRSLEHYLARCLDSSYGVSYVKAVRLLKDRVFHVHGMLSPLGMASDERQYRPDLDLAAAKSAAQSIKVVHEPMADGAGVQAHAMLSQAERVFFLGFGYDQANLAKLQWKRRSAYGTFKGLEPMEIQSINSRYGVRDHQGSGAIESLLRNCLPTSADN